MMHDTNSLVPIPVRNVTAHGRSFRIRAGGAILAECTRTPRGDRSTQPSFAEPSSTVDSPSNGRTIWGRVLRCIAITLAFLVPIAGGVSAQEQGDLPWKRGTLSLGGFITKSNSGLRVDSQTLGRGTQLNLRNLFGIDDAVNSFRADGFWRFFPRHRFDFSYYDLSQDGSRSLSATIQVGDQTFVLGTTVTTEFDLAIYKAGYSYSFVQNRRFELAASLGVFGLDTKFGITATGIGTQETASLFAPLPVVGLRGAYAVTPKLFVRAGIQYFGIDLGDVSGQLVDVMVIVDYDIFDNIAVGAGYNFVDLDLEAEESKLRGNLDFDYGGAIVFVKFFF